MELFLDRVNWKRKRTATELLFRIFGLAQCLQVNVHDWANTVKECTQHRPICSTKTMLAQNMKVLISRLKL